MSNQCSWAFQTILKPFGSHLENSGQFQLEMFGQKLSRRAKTFRVAMLPCYPGFFRLWLTANSEWSEFLSLSKWSVCWKVISAIRGNTPTDWAFWDWLYRTVMSPKAELAVQLCLFPYFHLRNNEIYSLLCGTTLLWGEEGYLDCTPCAQTIFPPIFIPDGLKRKIYNKSLLPHNLSYLVSI